ARKYRCSSGTDYPESEFCLHLVTPSKTSSGYFVRCTSRGAGNINDYRNKIDRIIIKESVPNSSNRRFIGPNVLGVETSSTDSSKFEWDKCKISTEPSGIFIRENCANNLDFICLQPYDGDREIRMELKTVHGSVHHVPPGHWVDLSCSSVKSDKSELVFQWEKTSGSITNISSQDLGAKQATITTATKQVMMTDGSCVKKEVKTLRYLGVKTGPEPLYYCCLLLQSLEIECADPFVVYVDYLDPEKPDLQVFYHYSDSIIFLGKKFGAQCTTHGGTLMWAIRNVHRVEIWDLDVNGTFQPKTEDAFVDEVEATVIERKMDEIKGEIITSRINFVVRLWHNQTVLYCFSKSTTNLLQFVNKNNKRRSESSPLIVDTFYPLQDLRFQVGYHQWDNVVFKNHTFSANCSAYVGSYGVLIWTLENNEKYLKWKINSDNVKSVIYNDIIFDLQINHS
ncbi:hypothetical protein EGW08_019556, partial [Elysia chlorotica]